MGGFWHGETIYSLGTVLVFYLFQAEGAVGNAQLGIQLNLEQTKSHNI